MDAFLAFEKKTKQQIMIILSDLETCKQNLLASGLKRAHDEEASPSEKKKKAVASSSTQLELYLGPQRPEKAKLPAFASKNYVSALTTAFEEDERKFTVLGNVPRAHLMPGFKPVIKEDPSSFTLEDWYTGANFLRKTPYEKFVSIFPHRREKEGDCCKAVITEGANPEKVYKLFCLGLVHCIYPSKELTEISHFPKNFLRAIEEFIRKTKSEKPLFLQIYGTIPSWKDGAYSAPHQAVRLGTVSGPPVLTKGAPLHSDADIEHYHAGSILDLLDELPKIEKIKNFKINYASSQILMTTLFKKPATSKELKKLSDWTSEVAARYLSKDETPAEPGLTEMQVEDAEASTSLPTQEDVFPPLGGKDKRKESVDTPRDPTTS